MKTYNFDDESPAAKQVENTQQLEPRTREEPFQKGQNSLESYRKDHGDLGALGDRGFAEKAKK